MIINTLTLLIMKKIYVLMLVAILAFSLNFCSNHDTATTPPAPTIANSVSMKVGGTIKTFNTVTVTQIPYTANGMNFVDLEITASNDGSTKEFLVFYIAKGNLGQDVSWDFNYTLNDVPYAQVGTSIGSEATVNSDNKLKGTFSGTVTSSTDVNLELTQGSFDITY